MLKYITFSVQSQQNVWEVIPVKPEKERLQENAGRTDNHKQQGEPDLLGLQEKANDVNSGGETQRSQD